MFLVDVRPKNAQKGKEVILYLREGGRSLIKEIEIPHIIPSFRRESSLVERGLEELRKIAEGKDIEFEKHEYKGQAVIHAKGPREMKKILPKYFLKTESSPTQMLRWQTHFPFSEVAEENGRIVFCGKVDPKILLEESAVAIDIEARGCKKVGRKLVGGEIFMASYVAGTENYIFVIDEIPAKEISVEGHTAYVIRCSSESALVEALADKIKEYDPLWIFGSNIMNFDLIKLRETKKFDIAVGGGTPKIRGKGGFFDKVIAQGRYVIDSAPFSLNWLWLPNNRLETVASYLLNRKIVKKFTPEEIEQLAQSRTPSAIAALAEYNFRDALLSFIIGKQILRVVLAISNLFEVDPSSVCTTGKKNLAQKVTEKRYFDKFKTLEKRKRDKEYEKFDITEVKVHAIEKYIDEKQIIKKGVYDAYVIYLTVFASAVFPYLLKPCIRYQGKQSKFANIMESGSAIEKIILAQALDAYIEKEIFDLWKFTKGKLTPPHSAWAIQENFERWFSYFYDAGEVCEMREGERRSAGAKTLLDTIDSNCLKAAKILKKAGLINFGRKFVFIKDPSAANELEESGLGLSLGRATVLSIARGRIVFMLESNRNVLLAEGIDPSGTKGDRSLFEQRLIEELCEAALTAPKSVGEIYDLRMRAFLNGEIPKEQLIYTTEEAALDYDNYSAPAQRRERIKAHIEYKVRKGESFSYGYGRVEEDLGEYKKGYVGIVKTPEFFDKKVLVEKQMYVKKWNESIREIISAVRATEQEPEQHP